MTPQIMTGTPFQVIHHTTFLWVPETLSKHTKFFNSYKESCRTGLDSLKHACLHFWTLLCESTFEELYKQSIKENPQIKHRTRDGYD